MTPIQVQCYSGHKADDLPAMLRIALQAGSPRRFLLGDRWIEVREIADRWYQGERDPEWPIADYFKVTGGDSRSYLLRHDRESGEWYLCEEGNRGLPRTRASGSVRGRRG